MVFVFFLVLKFFLGNIVQFNVTQYSLTFFDSKSDIPKQQNIKTNTIKSNDEIFELIEKKVALKP